MLCKSRVWRSTNMMMCCWCRPVIDFLVYVVDIAIALHQIYWSTMTNITQYSTYQKMGCIHVIDLFLNNAGDQRLQSLHKAVFFIWNVFSINQDITRRMQNILITNWVLYCQRDYEPIPTCYNTNRKIQFLFHLSLFIWGTINI